VFCVRTRPLFWHKGGLEFLLRFVCPAARERKYIRATNKSEEQT
jgi:hypothetical protein